MSSFIKISALLMVALVMMVDLISANDQSLQKEFEEQSGSSENNRYAALSKSLIRLILADPRYSQVGVKRSVIEVGDPFTLGSMGKRSDNGGSRQELFVAGDPFRMGGFGKRNELVYGKIRPQYELSNLNPLYGRYGSRYNPQPSDVTWLPFEV